MANSLRYRLVGASPRPGNHADRLAPPSRSQDEINPKPPETSHVATAPLAIGGAVVDLVAGRVRAPDGTETELRGQSAGVLRVLAARRGETVTKDELHQAVWGDIAVTEDSLVQCVTDIRRALGDARVEVQTLRGRGYRLAADLAATPPARWWRPSALLAGAVTLLVLAGAVIWSLRGDAPQATAPPAARGGPAVAVLPFENLAAASVGTGWRAA
jgi:DNA-binding winged helix-turn-helix (wHTH) protein